MATPIKQTDTTLIFDLRDFVPLDEAKHYLLCLSDNTYHVVFGLFQFYGYWLNRYTPTQDGDIWYKPEDEDAIFVGDMYDKGMEELAMTVCFDDLIEAINTNFANLTEAIAALELSVTVEPSVPSITIEPATADVNLTCAPDVNLTVNGGSGGSCSPNCGIGGGPVVQPDPAPGQPDPGPPNPADPPPNYPPEGPPYDAYKCAAANFLVDNYIAYVGNYTSLAGILSTYSSAVLSLMGINLFFAPLSPFFNALLTAVSTGFLWAYLLTVLPGVTGLAALFTSYKSNLDDDKEQFICDLYNAQDVTEARAVITSHITDTMPVGMPESWVSYHVDALFPNNVLNILFELYQPANDYVGSVDCANCDACEMAFAGETGWGTSDLPLKVNGTLITITPSQIVGGTFNNQYVLALTGGCACFEGGIRLVIEDHTGYDVYAGGGSGDPGDKGGNVTSCESVLLFDYADQANPYLEYCGVSHFQFGPQVDPFTIQVRFFADADCT